MKQEKDKEERLILGNKLFMKYFWGLCLTKVHSLNPLPELLSLSVPRWIYISSDHIKKNPAF